MRIFMELPFLKSLPDLVKMSLNVLFDIFSVCTYKSNIFFAHSPADLVNFTELPTREKPLGSIVPPFSKYPESSCCLLTVQGSYFSVAYSNLSLGMPYGSHSLRVAEFTDHWCTDSCYSIMAHRGYFIPATPSPNSVLFPKPLLFFILHHHCHFFFSKAIVISHGLLK